MFLKTLSAAPHGLLEVTAPPHSSASHGVSTNKYHCSSMPCTYQVVKSPVNTMAALEMSSIDHSRISVGGGGSERWTVNSLIHDFMCFMPLYLNMHVFWNPLID